jgi:DNA-binding beta-propeller fold protein YncE
VKRSRAALVALLAVAGAWLTAATSPAAAAPGQLAYDGCLADTAAQGCFDLPFAPLQGASGVAVSPDGKSVYVTSFYSDSVAHLFRGADGRLALDGCLSNDGSQNCVDLPSAPLDGAAGVAVSPDGRSVYVTSFYGNLVAHFFRDRAGGQIFYDGCLANDATQGCVDLPGAPLVGANGVAVSPDGKSVYVASYGSDSVAHFARNGPDGQIAYAGCLDDDGTQGCVDVPGAPLNGASGVAVSPDGKSVYVASFSGDSVGYLFRSTATGQLAWDGCLNNDGSQNCGNLPGAPLDGATGVAVSADGTSVYVASPLSDSIAHLFRSTATGQLAWDGCLNNDGTENCRDLPDAPLDGATGVAVSPDGTSVYVASINSDSVAHLFRSTATGQLAWDGCLNNDGTESCRDLPDAPLDGANAVAVSPDGTSVYVASINANSVAHFLRELAAPAPPAGPIGAAAPSEASSPRPAFGASTRVTVKLAAGRIGRRGPVRVLLANANAFAVTGTLGGTATVGAKRGVLKLTARRFTVAATSRTTLALALPKALRRELTRKRKLVLRLSVAVHDPAGNRRTVRDRVTPRLKAPRSAARPGARRLA